MGLTPCVAPVWSQRRLFPCSVVSIMCKDVSWEDQPTAMSVWRTDKPCLCLPRCSHCPAGARAPLLCCGSWPCSLLRQKVGCWHMVGLIIFVTSISRVYPGLLLAFPFPKWRWQCSYTVHVPPHLTHPPYHPNFPTVSAHACYLAWRYSSMAVPLNIKKWKDWHLGGNGYALFDFQFFAFDERGLRPG